MIIIMKKSYLSIFTFFLCFNLFGQKNQPFEFKKIYSYALQADVSKILSVLDTLSDESLTEKERIIKEKYFHRFKLEDEDIDYNTSDPLLKSLLEVYHSYWKKALLDNKQTEQYEEQLKNDVVAFLNEHGYLADTLSMKDVEDNFGQHLKNFLSHHNYYSATGKTAGLYDLFLWSKEVPKTYHVQLPETETATTVVFLEDVVTMGWEEYASFGTVYPGGWATKEMLYNVRKAYDTTSENYKVSYLKHEAQHFADYKAFPALTGADLEYRAKLVELVYADQTLYGLIRSFIRNANPEGRNPHAFANYAVIRDLSGKIFKQDFVSDIERWKKVPSKKIRKLSERLLKQHSKALDEIGAGTVAEFIK